MAGIAYTGGPNINTQFTATTRSGLLGAVKTALLAAGWTDLGSGNIKSGTTPTANLNMTVNLNDPGSGTEVSIVATITSIQTFSMWLHVDGARLYQIIANPYQFFIFVNGNFTAFRAFAAAGVPFIEAPWIGQIAQAVWAQGNASGSADGSNRTCWRFSSTTFDSDTVHSLCSVNDNPDLSGADALRLILGEGAQAQTDTDDVGRLWHTDQASLLPPRIGWGIINELNARIRGQLWDAALVMSPQPADITPVTFDTHLWWNVMHNANMAGARCSLWLVIPTP